MKLYLKLIHNTLLTKVFQNSSKFQYFSNAFFKQIEFENKNKNKILGRFGTPTISISLSVTTDIYGRINQNVTSDFDLRH